MATLTLTGKNAAEVRRIARALIQGAASYDDNRVVGTFTATDASPSVIVTTDALGNSITTTV
jgi:hypothetical protein